MRAGVPLSAETDDTRLRAEHRINSMKSAAAGTVVSTLLCVGIAHDFKRGSSLRPAQFQEEQENEQERHQRLDINDAAVSHSYRGEPQPCSHERPQEDGGAEAKRRECGSVDGCDRR